MQGQQINFRCIEEGDQEFLFRLAADPAVRANVVGWDLPRSFNEQLHWFKNRGPETQRYLVEREGEPLGMTGLWDINWHDRNALTALKLGGGKAARGQGYGTDAVKAMMAFAFYDVGLNRLYSTILADNQASLKVYIGKCNWQIEGTARAHVWRHGRFADLHHVGVLKSDFDNLKDAEVYRDLVLQP